MSYNLGLCSISFRKNSPEEILSAMKEAGLSVIEWGSDVHCPPEKAEEIAGLQKSFGITCSSYGTYFKFGLHNIAELESYISAAKTLGTKLLRLWCGTKNSEEYTEKEKAALFKECRKAAEIAEKNGVILCMECHNNTFTDTKASAFELMQAVNSKSFRMYWQPNQFRSEEENLAYARLLAPYTENVHVFNWRGNEKYPLSEGKEIWKNYLSSFSENKALLLEFMPKNTLLELKAEAEALKEITGG